MNWNNWPIPNPVLPSSGPTAPQTYPELKNDLTRRHQDMVRISQGPPLSATADHLRRREREANQRVRAITAWAAKSVHDPSPLVFKKVPLEVSGGHMVNALDFGPVEAPYPHRRLVCVICVLLCARATAADDAPKPPRTTPFQMNWERRFCNERAHFSSEESRK